MPALTQPHETILVVDDEPSICRLVKTVLEREGYAVFIAGNAKTAGEIHEAHSAEFALLLTDMKMPGTNGVELAESILRCSPQMRVLFMSGSDASSRGFGCLAKPFTRAQLLSTVNQALEGRPQAKLLVKTHAA